MFQTHFIRRHFFLGFSCLSAIALGTTGCWTSQSEGEALRQDMEKLKAELRSNVHKSNEERVKLQKIMEQATALLTRNNADVGAQVERLQGKVDQFEGTIEEATKRLNDLSQKFSEYQAKVDVKLEGLSNESAQNKNAPVPNDPEELFQQAQSKLTAGDHQEARRLLRHFITRFPTHARAAQTQLLLGDSYFAEQKFAPAIVEYKKIIETHAQSSVVPDALAKIGMSFYQLKYCSDAELFFSQLLKKYKNHAQASTATKILKLIKSYKKNPNFCNQ